MDRRPIIVAPYDAELFGHWWYEGPQWLDSVIRTIHTARHSLRMATPSDYLAEYPVNQVAVPSASSWGAHGYSEFWCDKSNDWIYPHLGRAGERMAGLADAYCPKTGGKRSGALLGRALNQAARELLLAQSSDWPFIMKAGTMVEYARNRVKQHINRFTKLYQDITGNTIDEPWLSELEGRDTIFADMDCAAYFRTGKMTGPKK